MIDEKELIPVYNRMGNGTVGYIIPELNLHRDFEAGETKKIPMDELRKLQWVPGGEATLKHFLVIQNAEAVAELLGEVEPEYYYTRADIEYLLTKGSLDQLEDCLNFAPKGVVECVAEVAVAIRLNDMEKRELIFAKTGSNVDRAIRAKKEEEDFLAKEGIVDVKAEAKTRKAAMPNTTAEQSQASAPVRKATAPKYNVIN